MNELPRKELLDRLAAKAVQVMSKTQVVRIEADRIVYQEEEGQERDLPIDTVVVAAGAVRDPSLAEELQGKVLEVYLAGDCDHPGTGGMAIRSGLAVGMTI
jgi:NADH dehydrogenase FAD-containing subunit